jgi:hypothetical protein
VSTTSPTRDEKQRPKESATGLAGATKRHGPNFATQARPVRLTVRAHNKSPLRDSLDGRPAGSVGRTSFACARHWSDEGWSMARARSSPCAAVVLLPFLAAAAASSITRRDFPPGFVFGVGSSAYQVYIACCSPSMAFLLESCASPIYNLPG